MEFSDFWSVLSGNLKEGNVVPRWTKNSGYLKAPITVERIAPRHLIISTPSAQTSINIPITDFEAVWDVWGNYRSGKTRRHEIRDVTRHSAYIISIMHSLEMTWLPFNT